MLIGATLRQATEEHVEKAIAGYGVALDLTLRDVQGKMKKAGQPWEKAKGFDNACPISGFIPAAEFTNDPQDRRAQPESERRGAPAGHHGGHDPQNCAADRLHEPLLYPESRVM